MKPGAALILLLVFMAVAITITTAATLLTISSTQAASRQDIGHAALAIAESGLENAYIQILRDPSFTGETLTVGSGVATITVSSVSGVFTLTSTGVVDGFSRTVRSLVQDNGGVYNLSSWTEIYP